MLTVARLWTTGIRRTLKLVECIRYKKLSSTIESMVCKYLSVNLAGRKHLPLYGLVVYPCFVPRWVPRSHLWMQSSNGFPLKITLGCLLLSLFFFFNWVFFSQKTPRCYYHTYYFHSIIRKCQKIYSRRNYT